MLWKQHQLSKKQSCLCLWMSFHAGESSHQCPAVFQKIHDTVVLLNNGHAVRCLLNIYVCSLVLLSALVREASLFGRHQSLHRLLTGHLYQPQTQGSGNIVEGERAERMREPEDGEKCHKMMSSGCHMAFALQNSWQVWLPAQDWACQHSIMDGGGGGACDPPTLTEELLAVDGCWEESHFSSVTWLLISGSWSSKLP